MNPTILRRLNVVLGVCLLGLVSATGVSSQQGSYKELNPKGQKAESPAISEKTLRFEITLSSGKLIKLLAKEGAMVKFGDLEEGYAYALVPVIKDMDKQSAAITVFELTQDEGGNESVRQSQRLDLNREAPRYSDTEPKFQIRLISTEPPPQASASPVSTKDNPLLAQAQATCQSGGPDCCLRCGQVWVCAICVWMDCGCCCDPPHACTEYP